MSHITTIKDFLFSDLQALQKAVSRLGDASLDLHEERPVRLFQKEPVLGVAEVNLKGWTYPVVVSKRGEIAYDNYQGSWGDIAQLNRLKQAYGLEKAKMLAKLQGYMTRETQKQDGSVVLELTR